MLELTRILHIVPFLAAFALLILAEAMLFGARHGKVGLVRPAMIASRLAGPLMGAGLLAGVVLLFVVGWSLTTRWLLLSMALIVCLIVIERFLVEPWRAQMAAAIAAGYPWIGLTSPLYDGSALIGRLIMLGILSTITILMVTKPGLGL